MGGGSILKDKLVLNYAGVHQLFIIILRMHLGQVLIPLHRQQLLFPDVALLAAGNDVPLDGSSAACNRNDMVHGQISGRGRTPAVMADPLCATAFPPLAGPKFAGFLPLSSDLGFIQIIGKGC